MKNDESPPPPSDPGQKSPSPTHFLPEYLIMVDCEMTGVVPERDALLQVAMLRLRRKGVSYEIEGEPLVEYLHYAGEPYNDFHRQYLGHIFKKCQQSELTPDQLKDKIHAWLGKLKGKISPVGNCVPTDLAFLFAKGCAERADIGDKGSVAGTFHYEYFELHSLQAVALQKNGKAPAIEGIDSKNVHDAYTDCLNQTLELNAYLKILL